MKTKITRNDASRVIEAGIGACKLNIFEIYIEGILVAVFAVVVFYKGGEFM